jgi:hypothetical protein
MEFYFLSKVVFYSFFLQNLHFVQLILGAFYRLLLEPNPSVFNQIFPSVMFLFISDFGCAPGAKIIGGFHLRHSPYGHNCGLFFSLGYYFRVFTKHSWRLSRLFLRKKCFVFATRTFVRTHLRKFC